ncbi:hypothetical protein [Streptomyces violascens]
MTKPVPRSPTEVSTRPSAVNSRRQGCAVSTRSARSPAQSSTTSPSRRTFPLPCSAPGSANSGPRRTEPAWWVVRTPITPAVGDQHSTVSSGLLSVSPRPRTCLTGA